MLLSMASRRLFWKAVSEMRFQKMGVGAVVWGLGLGRVVMRGMEIESVRARRVRSEEAIVRGKLLLALRFASGSEFGDGVGEKGLGDMNG